MLPYACDALLPTGQRYASEKFRLLARNFRLRKVPYEVACELVAFLHVVPLLHAKWIFQWNDHTQRRAKVIWEREDVQADVARTGMVEANLRACDVDVGLAVLDAMRDGGWTRGRLPDVVRMAVAELNHRKVRVRAISSRTGLSASCIYNAKNATPLSF